VNGREKELSNPLPWEVEGSYARGLDSLARFYNSQITVHVGYLLTSFAVMVAVFPLVRGGFEWVIRLIFIWGGLWPGSRDLTSFLSTLLGVAPLALYMGIKTSYPICFSYFLGRTQYYECLSQAVWDHMGVNTSSTDFVNQLLGRVGRPDSDGINHSVMTYFEYILYTTLCKKQKEEEKKVPRERAKELYHMTGIDLGSGGYDRSVLKLWKLPNLLLLAYKRTLSEYEKNNPEIYKLWRDVGAFDC
jgi:hypothetical protein